MLVIRIGTLGLTQRPTSVETFLRSIDEAWISPDQVCLDFSGCSFLTAEAVAVLAGLTRFREVFGLGTRIEEKGLRPDVRANLWKMGLLDILTGETCPRSGNSLPLYEQNVFDGPAIVRYIQQEVMARPEMPEMSSGLQKEIRRAFVEVFANVFHHSASPIGGMVCGQVYPNRGQIQLTFFDAGVGIARRVRDHVRGIGDDSTGIRWALERGTSTLALTEGHPRGLGLYVLREFLRVNGGQIQVYANRGYYSEHQAEQVVRQVEPPLRGTLIDLRIHIRPGVRYEFRDDDDE